MRVLFLSFSAGQGHNSAARACMAYLESRGAVCKFLDSLGSVDPRFSKITDMTYTRMVKYTPQLWKELYRIMEETSGNKVLEQPADAANILLARHLVRSILEFEPDAVVCSHVYGAAVLHAMRERGLLSEKVVTYGIVTDYIIHPYWEDHITDYLVLASPLLCYSAVRKGISADKLLPVGIPVHPKFGIKGSRSEAREKLGLRENVVTFLLMAGSIGSSRLEDAVKKIAAMPDDIQLIVVSGKNRRLKKHIDAMNSPKILSLGYANNVDELMDASDWIITKPGGLSTSEALAKNLPMLLIDPIPGIENRNEDFLTNLGAAMRCTDIQEMDIAVRMILDCPERADIIRDCQTRFMPRNGTAVLGDIILSNWDIH